MNKLVVAVLACGGAIAIVIANEIATADATSALAAILDRQALGVPSDDGSQPASMKGMVAYGGAGAIVDAEYVGIASNALPRSPSEKENPR